jgi:MFS family permease
MSQPAAAVSVERMTGPERRASLSLAFIYAMRMLGLFLVLPVFALEAPRYPGGDDPALVGLAMGIYGLTQGLLQLPFGMASDRLGRKRVIVFGLLVFAAGSALAASADTLLQLILGRCLQGAGAVSAVVTALLADQTRDAVRTKAMALVGASIGLMFALSLVVAPALAAWIGLAGLFAVTAALALVGIVIVLTIVPPEPPRHAAPARGSLRTVLTHVPMLRLNAGVFVLHAVLLAMWVAVPQMLVDAGLAQARHWWVYLPTIGASFFVMSATLFPLERRGYLRAVFLAAIALMALVQIGFALTAWVASPAATATATAVPSLAVLAVLLFLFFCGSNVLEAAQPSIASRTAPAEARGAALGFYNTLQSLGFFAGGAVGGLLLKASGPVGLFAACALATLAWLALAWPMAPYDPATGASAGVPSAPAGSKAT